MDEVKKSKRTINRDDVVIELRKKLIKGGHSLLWWHRTYIPKLYKYNYFIRQINLPESMQDDLLDGIVKYIGD